MKMLWGRSGNRCAICKCELVADSLVPADDPSVIGDMAHIVARKASFTRGNYDELTEDQREAYGNRILVCKIDHKKIDDQPAYFTVERLREIKTGHEQWVREQLSEAELNRQKEAEVYAAYVEDFMALIDIERWTIRGTWICSPEGPEIETEYFERLRNVGPWIISRLWPDGDSDLKSAFANFRDVLGDFLSTFNQHAEFTKDRERLVTARFYRSEVWLEQDEYHERVRRFEEHTALVEDLFLELTRALNYICDLVRKHVIPSFRLREGAVLVERDNVGFGMRIEHLRPEYRGDQRAAHPYPGLEVFKKERYKRDFFVNTKPDG